MAIVFISPKAKQKTFFTVIITIITLSLTVAFLVFVIVGFASMNKNATQDTPFDEPDIAINLGVIDSDKVKNLEPFYNLETQFTYIVQDEDGKEIQGNISAATKEEAKMLLEESYFKVLSLEEGSIGRSDPFTSY